ncbi:PASTA domain-containing protein [Saccharothrix longispora]|uniref:PASTA domain-containing protein n=1 Tax=Saccharothrix longispora TaxID=33920 RepID=A0ABU1PRQ1_9PSEU|nr:PASTA domain-containing protein [Saccharothrix longispora]MDR6593320.1 hypothetical protein [Saccharothrix longispora]
MKTRLSVLVAGAALLAACSPSSQTARPAAATTAPAATTSAVTPAATPGTSAAALAPTAVAPAPAPPSTCTVPDVVGMVHQTAQDTMQAAGLYNLREEDATGRGRVLVLDRNWTTTAQSVPAGSSVDCLAEVRLSAVKIGE